MVLINNDYCREEILATMKSSSIENSKIFNVSILFGKLGCMSFSKIMGHGEENAIH